MRETTYLYIAAACSAVLFVWYLAHAYRGLRSRPCPKCQSIWVMRIHRMSRISARSFMSETDCQCLSCNWCWNLRPKHRRDFKAWSYAWRMTLYRRQIIGNGASRKSRYESPSGNKQFWFMVKAFNASRQSPKIKVAQPPRTTVAPKPFARTQ